MRICPSVNIWSVGKCTLSLTNMAWIEPDGTVCEWFLSKLYLKDKREYGVYCGLYKNTQTRTYVVLTLFGFLMISVIAEPEHVEKMLLMATIGPACEVHNWESPAAYLVWTLELLYAWVSYPPPGRLHPSPGADLLNNLIVRHHRALFKDNMCTGVVIGMIRHLYLYFPISSINRGMSYRGANIGSAVRYFAVHHAGIDKRYSSSSIANSYSPTIVYIVAMTMTASGPHQWHSSTDRNSLPAFPNSIASSFLPIIA